MFLFLKLKGNKHKHIFKILYHPFQNLNKKVEVNNIISNWLKENKTQNKLTAKHQLEKYFRKKVNGMRIYIQLNINNFI